MLHLGTSQAFIAETCAPLLHVLGGGTGVAGKRSRVVLRVDEGIILSELFVMAVVTSLVVLSFVEDTLALDDAEIELQV